MPQQSSQAGLRSGLGLTALSLRMMVGATIALWTLDVLVNLDLPGRWVAGRLFHSTLEDFLGLLAGELQVAGAAVAGMLLLGGAAAVLRRSVGVLKTGVPWVRLGALALALPLFVAQAHILWDASPSQYALIVRATLIPATFLAAIMFFPGSGGRGFETEGVFRSTFPALWAVAAANRSASAFHSGERAALVAAVSSVVLALLLVGIARRRAAWARAVTWLPVAGAVLLAVHSVQASRHYGEDGTEDAYRPLPAKSGRTDDAPRPNIVLIVLDTVRADHLQRYGYRRNTMPSLERWAEKAVVFERAVSPAGWTAPAHASIFSGKPVSEHGIHHGSTRCGGLVYQTKALPGISWLPERLAQSGYYCLAVIANPVALPPEVEGFHRVFRPWHEGWYDGTVAALADNHLPWTQRLSERIRWRLPYMDAREIAGITTRATVARDRPTFLFVNFLDAHSPYDPPESVLEALGPRSRHAFRRYLPHTALTMIWEQLPSFKQAYLEDLYDGELRWLDTQLGPLLNRLERRLGQNTVFIVTSDHGEELGEGGRVGHEYGLGQPIVHVPLFISGPGIRPGTVETPVSLRRLYDFILGVAQSGSPVPGILSAPDPLRLVVERYAYYDSIRVFGETYDRDWVVMYEDGYKGEGPSAFGFRLFDVRSEGFDRAIDASGVGEAAEALSRAIDDYWASRRDRRGREPDDTAGDKEGEVGPDTEDMLKQLGYIND